MARLLYISAQAVLTQRRVFTLPRKTASGFKPARPKDHALVEPWFEVSTLAPAFDSRAAAIDGIGVVAWFETYGGASGPDLRKNPSEVVLSGNPVPSDAPPPDDPAEFRRQCSARVVIVAEGLDHTRQLLVILPLVGRGPSDMARVQLFLGNALLSELTVTGEEVIALLLDVPGDRALSLEFWVRLCGSGPTAAAGVRGAAGYRL